MQKLIYEAVIVGIITLLASNFFNTKIIFKYGDLNKIKPMTKMIIMFLSNLLVLNTT